MADLTAVRRDDRILRYTRVLSAVIVPFLLGAWVILYLFPQDTGRLFAWPIKPTMTSMVLASAYLGGAYFFLRVLRERHWHVVAIGFVSVALFAGLLGVATLLHWDRFSHAQPTFWIWTALYLTTPFLVIGGWFANRRHAAGPRPEEPRIGSATRWVIAAVGLLALLQGIVMSVAPQLVIPLWPWTLTPLTCRVVGAIFCLGCAGLAVLADPRWSSLKLMLQVEVVMVVSMFVAVVRALPEFDTSRLLTWPLLAGFVAVLIGSLALVLRRR